MILNFRFQKLVRVKLRFALQVGDEVQDRILLVLELAVLCVEREENN
jgi:hypothetical protein